MASSSPVPETSMRRRPAHARTLSAFSERAPLVAVPTIELPRRGDPILMGRSSHSSDYQLSANKLISRVHVRAAYVAADPPQPKKVQVECMGWNGVTVHCEGKAWELRKGDSFTSETEDAGIMIDVHDARVLLQWPRHEAKLPTPTNSESTWDEENSPRQANAVRNIRSPRQSPLRQRQRLQSPVSPSPAVHAPHNATSTLLGPNPSSPAVIQVYEDEQSGDEMATQATQRASQPFGMNLQESQSSASSVPGEFSDGDEENDPIVHSFGPFGANLMPRMEAFTTDTPERRPPLKAIPEASVSPQGRLFDAVKDNGSSPVINHVINQLAYSRLSSTPISTLLDNLPSRLRSTSPSSKENTDLNLETLKIMLDLVPCIGEVPREGKDAAGKALESEYHYIPEMDADENRRNAVVEELKKPGLRACRKQHKVKPSGVCCGLHREHAANRLPSNTFGVSPSRYSKLKIVSVEAWTGSIDTVSVSNFFVLYRCSMSSRGITTVL